MLLKTRDLFRGPRRPFGVVSAFGFQIRSGYALRVQEPESRVAHNTTEMVIITYNPRIDSACQPLSTGFRKPRSCRPVAIGDRRKAARDGSTAVIVFHRVDHRAFLERSFSTSETIASQIVFVLGLGLQIRKLRIHSPAYLEGVTEVC
jgi:hypothetical protein